jgi:hypothetical protein
LFSKNLVIIPVHLSIHWCCACIDFEQKRIEYYDSLHGRNEKAFKLLRSYLEKESLDKRNVAFDLSEWQDFCPKVLEHFFTRLTNVIHLEYSGAREWIRLWGFYVHFRGIFKS